MLSEGTKRIVVIRELNSNMIEEAILVLKNGPAEAWEKSRSGAHTQKKSPPDFLLKEAEMIIHHYLKENQGIFEPKGGKEKRKGEQKRKISIGTMINLALIGSILVLVFILSKLLYP